MQTENQFSDVMRINLIAVRHSSWSLTMVTFVLGFYRRKLKRLGLPDEAEGVLGALASGSTGSECLGLVGQAIKGLRKKHHSLSFGALAPFIVPCVGAVKLSWPHYK